MEFKYRHDLKELNQLAQDLEAYGESQDINPAIMHCFNLCLDELLTNIISYGYDDAPDHAAHLAMSYDGQTIQATLKDEGKPFNPLDEAPEPDLESELEDRCIGGLGIHFCKEMMDSITYTREGSFNVLILRKSAAMPDLPND